MWYEMQYFVAGRYDDKVPKAQTIISSFVLERVLRAADKTAIL